MGAARIIADRKPNKRNMGIRLKDRLKTGQVTAINGKRPRQGKFRTRPLVDPTPSSPRVTRAPHSQHKRINVETLTAPPPSAAKRQHRITGKPLANSPRAGARRLLVDNRPNWLNDDYFPEPGRPQRSEIHFLAPLSHS